MWLFFSCMKLYFQLSTAIQLNFKRQISKTIPKFCLFCQTFAWSNVWMSFLNYKRFVDSFHVLTSKPLGLCPMAFWPKVFMFHTQDNVKDIIIFITINLINYDWISITFKQIRQYHNFCLHQSQHTISAVKKLL